MFIQLFFSSQHTAALVHVLKLKNALTPINETLILSCTKFQYWFKVTAKVFFDDKN